MKSLLCPTSTVFSLPNLFPKDIQTKSAIKSLMLYWTRIWLKTSCSRSLRNTGQTGLVVLAGEISSAAKDISYQSIVRKVLNGIGYDHSDKGFDGNTCSILVALEGQSVDINRGVDKSSEDRSNQGAAIKE